MPTPKSEDDRILSDFWRNYAESDRGAFGYLAANPLAAARAMLAIRKLSHVYPGHLSETPGGREIQRVLDQKGPLGLPARWLGFSVLPVPDDPAGSLETPEAKRLRYHLRQAESAGITCRPVGPDERDGLLDLANHQERNHSNPDYRNTQPSNDDLLAHDLWVVAEDELGQPLLLAVTAADGEFAVLRYFRRLGDSEVHTLSRYAAHLAVVEALAERGVRWLLDTEAPGAQTNGVRMFQRILGFRHIRIRKPGRGQLVPC